MIDAIVSGGQTGADRGGLLAAKELDIGSGGYAPKGWKTDDGPCPELEDFGLIEDDSEDYVVRTKKNVEIGDGTVIFGQRSVGSNKTEEFARQLSKPCCWVIRVDGQGAMAVVSAARTLMIDRNNYRAFRLWLKRNNIKILNVAGNRLSKNPGIDIFVQQFLVKALKGMK